MRFNSFLGFVFGIGVFLLAQEYIGPHGTFQYHEEVALGLSGFAALVFLGTLLEEIARGVLSVYRLFALSRKRRRARKVKALANMGMKKVSLVKPTFSPQTATGLSSH